MTVPKTTIKLNGETYTLMDTRTFSEFVRDSIVANVPQFFETPEDFYNETKNDYKKSSDILWESSFLDGTVTYDNTESRRLIFSFIEDFEYTYDKEKHPDPIENPELFLVWQIYEVSNKFLKRSVCEYQELETDKTYLEFLKGLDKKTVNNFC